MIKTKTIKTINSPKLTKQYQYSFFIIYNDNTIKIYDKKELNLLQSLKINDIYITFCFIISNDSFMVYTSQNIAKVFSKINKDKNKGANDFQFQINFNESKFQLNNTLDGKEALYLDINEFIIIYRCDSNGEIPYGNYMISLNNISTNIASYNKLRYLFSTDKDFLRIKINFSETLLSLNILMDDLIINLSYTDILSFFKAYSLNLKLYKIKICLFLK